MRSGAEYVEGLRDGREVLLDGERVEDVTAHPAFAPAIEVIAATYDRALAAASPERYAFVDETTGRLCSDMWRVPRTTEDLRRRRAVHELWAEASHGLMGRTPDHVASMLSAFRGSLDLFARNGERFAENVRRTYERARDEDLYVAYVIVPPQIDRSKPAHQQPEPFLYAGVCGEDEDGIVLRGAQMVGTSAVMADELFLSSIVPLVPGDEDYAVSCIVPVNAPGLRLHPRRPYALGATSTFDYPLSSRYDEGDAVVVFDDVRVPWERVFVHRDVDLVREQFYDAGAHQMTNFQSLIRLVAKLRFAAGLGLRLTELQSLSDVPAVKATLGGKLAVYAELFDALVLAAEAEPRMRGDLALPNPRFVYTGMTMHRQLIGEVMRQLRELAGGSFVAVPSSYEALVAPISSPDMERYYRSADVPARERIAFLRLMWDFVGTEFAGRQLQYEMFYSASQTVSDMRVYRYFDWEGAGRSVDGFLEAALASAAEREGAR